MVQHYRIRIFSSFCASENCKDIYERLCEAALMENYGPDKEIFITNGDDYTHVIILNTAMPRLNPNIPRKNVIGMAFEPPRFLNLTPQFVEYAKRHIGNYYIGDSEGLGKPFVERYAHMWYNPPLKQKPEKTKIMSMMVSEKMGESGHIYRHKLVNKILETDLPIDIYGRGCKFYTFLGDERVKGEFSEIEPYEKYRFHIAIENLPTNHYFSEKIMNPLLASTVPIYLGCRNISKYFGDDVIILTGNIDEDMKLLRSVCGEPSSRNGARESGVSGTYGAERSSEPYDKYVKSIDVEKVKNRIYLLRNLDELFSF